MNINAHDIAERMYQDTELCDGEVVLDLQGYRIGLRSNSPELLETLGIYFAHTLGQGPADLTVTAIEREANDYGCNFTDWKREPGKTGRKDAYVDLADARLVQKVRTGMVFLQHPDHPIAAGPCLQNDNQVINFINAQYMNHLQQNNALICHASGLCANGKTLGIAGFSGGGKSTLMLHLMAHKGTQYLTNDRLFLMDGKAIGIPKLPRVNPGTMLHDENLIDLLPADRRAELETLSPAELWDIEEKYDVFVEDVYGDGKIVDQAPIKHFLILNWKRDASTPCDIQEVKLMERKNLLDAVMKSPGPFYQYKDGTFYQDDTRLDAAPYLEQLKDVKVFEATGRIDFDYAQEFCLQHLLKV